MRCIGQLVCNKLEKIVQWRVHADHTKRQFTAQIGIHVTCKFRLDWSKQQKLLSCAYWTFVFSRCHQTFHWCINTPDMKPLKATITKNHLPLIIKIIKSIIKMQ